MESKYKNIPDELKALNRWVCVWNESKVPMQTGKMKAASSTNPDTWGSFKSACSAVDTDIYDHIGFVFNDDGYVGIDIDDGFTEDGFMTDLCIDIMKHTMSYTEKSRSGRGIHIFLKGDLPFTGLNNLCGVEIYKTGRYFITTGEKLVYEEIRASQEAIDYVVEKYFSDVKRPASEGSKCGEKIYKPIWERFEKKIKLRPVYPEIQQGGRNVSLLSLGGQLITVGFSPEELLAELMKANDTACVPPLSSAEVRAIVKSVERYRRTGD